jgi:hypothetical protein
MKRRRFGVELTAILKVVDPNCILLLVRKNKAKASQAQSYKYQSLAYSS